MSGSTPAAPEPAPASTGSQVLAASAALASVAPTRRGAVLLLASGRSDLVKAVPLLDALAAQPDLPPALLVSVAARGARWIDLEGSSGTVSQRIVLGDDVDATMLESRFERLLAQCAPRAVLVLDGDARSQRCAAVAHRQGVPLVHVGTDPQGADESAESPRAAIARIAGLRFACQSAPGCGDPGAVEVGSLLVDAIQAVQRQSGSPTAPELSRVLDERRGYALAWLKQPPVGCGRPWREERVELLHEVALDLPVVWPMAPAVQPLPGRAGLGDGIVRIDELDHAGFIALMADATCVLTDSLDVIEEAAALAVPCLSLGPRHASERAFGGWLPAVPVGHSAARATRAVWDAMFNLAPPVTPPALWDGRSASRIATAMTAWLGKAAAKRAG